MASEPEFFSGLIRSDESRQLLSDTATPFGGTANKLEYPPEFDPRNILRVEDQGRRNSCVGHGYSSCGEACGWLDSGGEFKRQFSRWGCYIWAQSLSGPRPGKTWLGADQGAGVDGAVAAAKKWGFCPEEIWPYPAAGSPYSTKVPAGAIEAAAPFRLQTHANIKSYDQGFEWMNQGKGPLLIGIDWTTGLLNNSGEITQSDLRTRLIGGHCVFLWGWAADGRIWLGNSYTVNWGQRGWRLVRPEVVDLWARQGDVWGMSDLLDVTQSRPVVVDYGEGW